MLCYLHVVSHLVPLNAAERMLVGVLKSRQRGDGERTTVPLPATGCLRKPAQILPSNEVAFLSHMRKNAFISFKLNNKKTPQGHYSIHPCFYTISKETINIPISNLKFSMLCGLNKTNIT